MYLEFTNDLNDRHIRKADPQTSDDSGAGEGLRGSVRGSDAARDEKPARGLRSSLLKGEFRSTTFTRRPLASWLDVREANQVPSKNRVYEEFEQRSAKSSETPEPQATPNQQEPGRSYPRRFEKLTRGRDRSSARAGAAEPAGGPRVGGREESGAGEKNARTEDSAVRKPDKGSDEKTDDETGPPRGPVLFDRGEGTARAITPRFALPKSALATTSSRLTEGSHPWCASARAADQLPALPLVSKKGLREGSGGGLRDCLGSEDAGVPSAVPGLKGETWGTCATSAVLLMLGHARCC